MANPKLEAVIAQALAVDRQQREAVLDAACAGDAELRQQAAELLRQRDRDAQVAQQPTNAVHESGTEPETATLRSERREEVGGSIGPYKLLDELGAGGMGTVYLAEQEKPVRRRVALKVIKPGLDTNEVIARFEAERQALALMDHAHIARVLDAGTTQSGRPYFVMELVRGVPITRYCDAHRVRVRERLELFLPVCRAVQHAHQKGIIHRDLKPSNILVTLRDDKAVSKIIDFGIAKATTQRLTERTLFTQHGQLIGTPDYMSPEQAGLGGLDVDTRSDVYSLGAVLYELLCGDTPLGHARLKRLDYVSMLNVIYEEEPPTPSRRVTELGEKLADLARRRDIEPQKLTQSLRGELDWIVTRALEKERTRRYESASALASDIERYLANEPVEACPPSKVYRLQKFVRRNRAPLAAAAMIAIVLVGGIIASTWQAVRAWRAERAMAAERRAAVTAKEDAEESQRLAEERRVEAESATKLLASALAEAKAAAENEKLAAERERDTREELAHRLRVADAMRLAMQSKDALEQYPQRALLLAAEAVEATRRDGEPIIPAAHQALHEALTNIGGRPLPGHRNSIHSMEVSPDGRWLFTSDRSFIRRWDLAADDPALAAVEVGGPSFRYTLMKMSPNGRWLATAGWTTNSVQLQVWNLYAEEFAAPALTIELPTRLNIQELSFSASNRLVAVMASDQAWVWDIATEEGAMTSLLLEGENPRFEHLAISANDRWAVALAVQDGNRDIQLWDLVDKENGTTPRALTDSDDNPSEFVLSPDGRWLATTGRETQPRHRVWDLSAAKPWDASRELQIPVQLASSRIQSITPDNRFLVTTEGSPEHRIRLWDLSTEQWQAPHATLSISDSVQGVYYPTSLSVDWEGRFLFAVAGDGSIYRWDLRDSDPDSTRTVIGTHVGQYNVRCTFSPSGRWLITSRHRDFPRLWDLSGQNPAIKGAILRGHDGKAIGVQSARRGPNRALGERWLITYGKEPAPRLWDLHARDPLGAGALAGRWEMDGQDVAVNPEGKWVIHRGWGSIRVVEPSNYQPFAGEFSIRTGRNSWGGSIHYVPPDDVPPDDVPPPDDPPPDDPLSRDGRWLALNHSQEVTIWDLTTEKLLEEQTPEAPNFVRRLWNLNFGRGDSRVDAVAPHRSIQVAPEMSFRTIFMSPDGRWLVTGHGDGHTRLWNLKIRAADESPAEPIDLGRQESITFSPDGNWLATWSNARRLLLWDLRSDVPSHVALRSDDVAIPRGDISYTQEAAFSEDGQWLVTLDQGVVCRWRLEVGRSAVERIVLNYAEGFLRRVAVSDDGQWVAASTSNSSVLLWEPRTTNGEESPKVLGEHDDTVKLVTFSPGGQLLATASQDGDVRLWNLLGEQLEETSIVVHRLDGEASSPPIFYRLQFGPNAEWLAAATHEGVYLWQLHPSLLVENAYRLAGRDLSVAELARYRLDVKEVLRGRILRSAEQTARRLEADPKNTALMVEHAMLLGWGGRLREAAQELAMVVRLEPDNHEPRYWLLPLLVETNQPEEYVRHCEEMWTRFGQTDRAEIYERAAKGSLLWPKAGFDMSKSAILADRAVNSRVNNILAYTESTKALAEYRQGNYESAIEWAEKCLGRPGNAYNRNVPALAVVAMSQVQIGQPDKARRALENANSLFARVSDAVRGNIGALHDYLICEILLREAEAVLATGQ